MADPQKVYEALESLQASKSQTLNDWEYRSIKEWATDDKMSSKSSPLQLDHDAVSKGKTLKLMTDGQLRVREVSLQLTPISSASDFVRRMSRTPKELYWQTKIR